MSTLTALYAAFSGKSLCEFILKINGKKSVGGLDLDEILLLHLKHDFRRCKVFLLPQQSIKSSIFLQQIIYSPDFTLKHKKDNCQILIIPNKIFNDVM